MPQRLLRELQEQEAMRGFSPNLILGKQVHPLFQGSIDATRKSNGFYDAVVFQGDWVQQQYSNSEDPYYAKYMGDVANVLMESSAIYFHLLKNMRTKALEQRSESFRWLHLLTVMPALAA